MASRYAAAGEGPPAKEGTGHSPIRFLIADGHGMDCIESVTREGGLYKPALKRVPPNRYYITFQTCGKLSYYSSSKIQKAVASRVPALNRVPPKPADPSVRCDSDYMEFKHQLARVFRTLNSIRCADPEQANTPKFRNMLKETEARKDAPLKTYSPHTKEYLCEFYDQYIHIHYPGDEYVDNTFVPTSYSPTGGVYMSPQASMGGILDKDMLVAVGLGTPLMLNRPVSEAEDAVRGATLHPGFRERRQPIENFYMASVYPTLRDVREMIDKKITPRAASLRLGQPRKHEAEEAVIEELYKNRDWYRTVSQILEDPALTPKASAVFEANGRADLAATIAAFEPPEGAPIVLAYPVCRYVPPNAPVLRAASLAAAASYARETSGGKRRRTYRKKRRVRKSTRRTRQ